jgi:hypothetical protein
MGDCYSETAQYMPHFGGARLPEMLLVQLAVAALKNKNGEICYGKKIRMQAWRRENIEI